MTVLSDGTLRGLIDRGDLVPGGDSSRAVHCAYEFVPGKIFPGGASKDDTFVVDWTNTAQSVSQVRFTIEPSAVVWVRALHPVRIPKDVCGLWIKTNTLSRQGLMMVNSSLVEPGYEGYLSCNFVNFGSKPVYLTPTTTIAKLLFLRLDADALVSYGKPFPDYDDMIARTAAEGPKTFLQISDVAATLERERVEAIKDIREEMKKQVDAAAPDIKRAREEEFGILKSDFQGYLYKALGGVAAVVVLLACVSWISDHLRGYLASDRVRRDEVEQMIEKEISKRMSAPSTGGTTASPAPSSATREPGPGTGPSAFDAAVNP